MIHKDNYIEILVDLLDGVLSPAEEEAVREFLEQHPEIQEEFEGLSKMYLQPGSAALADKKSLKKSPQEYFAREEVFEQYCLAYLEEDLDPEQRTEFRKYLESHPAKAKEFSSYQRARLEPDPEIRYPRKSQLKRYGLLRQYRATLITVSAAAAMLVFAWLLVLQPAEYTQEQTAERAASENATSGRDPMEISSPSNTSMEKLEKRSPDKLRTGNVPEPGLQIVETTSTRDETVLAEMNKLEPLRIASLSNTYESPDLTAQVRRKTYTGTRQMTLSAYLGEKANEIRILPEAVKAEEDNALLKALLIAGVDGFNQITGEKVNIITQYNEQGNLVKLGLESPIMAFNAPLRKNED